MITIVFSLKIQRHYSYNETNEVYRAYKSLKFLFQQRDLIVLFPSVDELLNDNVKFYYLISFRKETIVADALRKSSMDYLARIAHAERLLT